MTRLLLAGATGLVGRELLSQAVAAGDAVCALVRRRPAAADAAVDWRVVDFTALPALPAAGQALCALGTTLRVAGSQAAFRAVDFDAVLAFARAAQAAGVQRLGVVSALGASERSSNFYSRTKGEAEAALRALGFARLVIARPSLLSGNRGALGQARRRGEALALAATAPLQALIPAAWRPIDAAVVARALLRALAAEGAALQVLTSAELQRLGRSG